MKYRLGIDIGGTKIAYGIVDKNGVIVYRHQTPTNRFAGPDEFLESLVRDISGVLEAQAFSRGDLVGMALGFPSYVDHDRGVVVLSGSMTNLRDFHARDGLKKHFPDILTIVDNDTNIAAIEEHSFGAGKGYDHMMYTAVSTGIGSGFILNGKIYRGAYGGAGESGHMLITPDEGPMCGCDNRGCFMSNMAGSMIIEHAKKAINEGRESLISSIAGDLESLSAAHIHEAFLEGDGLATELIDQIGYYMGVYTYNFFTGLNINCYVMGGGMMKIGEPLMQRIRDTFDRYNHYKDQEVYLKYAELGQDTGIIGAAELLRDK